MEIRPLSVISPSSLDNLLLSLPFYKQVKQESRAQYDLLLTYSRLFEFTPSSVLLEKGRKDNWLYFLLRGQLSVLTATDQGQEATVNIITPGEVFGDIALILDQERTATVIADKNCKRVLVFGTNFDVFGELTDFSQITLQSKLIFYRNMVHNLRWKLEMYRSSYPDQDFSSDHRKIRLFSGTKDTVDELKSLEIQAQLLAKLIINWNANLQRLMTTSVSNVASATIASPSVLDATLNQAG